MESTEDGPGVFERALETLPVHTRKQNYNYPRAYLVLRVITRYGRIVRRRAVVPTAGLAWRTALGAMYLALRVLKRGCSCCWTPQKRWRQRRETGTQTEYLLV
jgi:hypothetical protein